MVRNTFAAGLQLPTMAPLSAPTPYDDEIASVDRRIGRFIGALQQKNALDHMILVITSDHGESLGEHGEATHAEFIYELTVRVLLILRSPPKLPTGEVYEAPVRIVDLMPTMLGLVGVEPSNYSQGRDLRAAFAGAAPPPTLAQYSESLHPELQYGMAPLYGLWWMSGPKSELRDLSSTTSKGSG